MGIKVAVLEKDFASLSELGLPVSLCLHLQEKNLVLREALWNAKATRSGFSISLFWPADPPRPQPVFSKTKKRRPRRRCRKRSMFQYRQSNKRIKIQLIPKNPTTVQIPLQRTRQPFKYHCKEPDNRSNTTAKNPTTVQIPLQRTRQPFKYHCKEHRRSRFSISHLR